MAFLDVLVNDILGNAAILVGLFALIGLLLQKKTAGEVFSGTVKTIVGMLIFSIGAGAAVASLDSFQALFTEGFGVQGVVPISEGVTAMALTKFGAQIAWIMVLGIILNMVVARFTPMKYVFLTGQHNLFFAAILTIVVNAAGIPTVWGTILGGLVLGFFAAFFPWIARNGMREITGTGDIGIGHYVTIGYAASSWIGSKVGKPEQSTEKIKLPKGLQFFRDYVPAIALTMILFFYIATFAAGKAFTTEVADGVNWLVFPLIQGLMFAAAVYVIITGIRMLLGEIVPAFLGISQRLIPGVKPALDCPAVFPYAPTAVIIGFLSAYIAGLVMMVIYMGVGWPVIIPVAIPYFFIGGTAGVFGNATGGWKGAILGSAFVGILISLGPQAIYPIMANVGLEGSSFPETDFTAVALPMYYIMKLGDVAGSVVVLLVLVALGALAFMLNRRDVKLGLASGGSGAPDAVVDAWKTQEAVEAGARLEAAEAGESETTGTIRMTGGGESGSTIRLTSGNGD